MPENVRFSTLNPDGTEVNVRYISNADIQSCPAVILVPEHYREDGSCRCNQKTCEYNESDCTNFKHNGEIYCRQHLEMMYGDGYLRDNEDEED